MDKIKSTNIQDNKLNTEIKDQTNIKQDKNIFDIAVKIIQKQIMNFDPDPENHFSRMNNEEIMRE
jgi:hypothetical protein